MKGYENQRKATYPLTSRGPWVRARTRTFEFPDFICEIVFEIYHELLCEGKHCDAICIGRAGNHSPRGGIYPEVGCIPLLHDDSSPIVAQGTPYIQGVVVTGRQVMRASSQYYYIFVQRNVKMN